MKKTARIILAIFMVCISVFGLCSCGSGKKSIIGTWSTTTIDHDIISFTFADDNTARYTFESHFSRSDNESEDFNWEIHSKYTYTDKDGEKTTYKPTDRYEGVLVLIDKDGDVDSIAYYRFDKEKERLYLVSSGDNKSELSLNRE